MKVCIDAGHGGPDPGAIGTNPFEFEEKEFNLALALMLEEELEWRGHWVVMTRRRDRGIALAARADHANRLGAELFVSIHANAAATSSAEGMEVFHFAGSARGREAAIRILDEMTTTFPGHKDRGVKEGNFAVLRLTKMPAVLVECEFITNPEQLLFLHDLENQLELADAISEGIDVLAW